MFALGGAIVVLRRDAAWAALAAVGLVAVLSLFGAVLAWRAARRARKAVALLEELRRTVRRPQPSIVPGPLGGHVPEMVPPETVFPEYAAPPPPEPPAPEPAPPPEERPTGRAQRPPPDISRYEVRLPGGETRAHPARSDEPSPSTASPMGRQEPVAAPPAGTAAPAPPESASPAPADETGVLLQALQDPDPFVRAKALTGLAGRPGVEPAVAAALSDDYPMVRREAVRALRSARSSPAAQALVDVVSHDPSAEVREEAVAVLADLLQ